jgi:hypothetical protein
MKELEDVVPILMKPVLGNDTTLALNVPVIAALPTAVFELVVTAVFEITVMI